MRLTGVCPNEHVVVVEIDDTKNSRDRGYAADNYFADELSVGCICGYIVVAVRQKENY